MTEPTDVLHGGMFEVDGGVDELRRAQRTLSPFDDRVVEFVAELSRALRRRRAVQESPALSALAYWIRPATVARLRDDWNALEVTEPAITRVPRGVVFHMPPTNVDTLFVYSWLLSALCGNANVVRLSPRALDASSLLVDVIRDILCDHDAVADTTAIVSFAHQTAVTQALSSADVRVIWGGDDAVAAIRAVPSAPYTRDLAFPDRFSMTAMNAATVALAGQEELDALTHALYNDAYWFDQLGCASPRLIVWVGDASDATVASARLVASLRAHLEERGHPPPPTSAVMAKFVQVADAASRDLVASVDRADNALTLARAKQPSELQRDSPGGGLFYEMRLTDLVELAPLITRRDQTLGVHGIDNDDITRFIEQLGSRGIDRIVPVGQALSFSRYWDGVDLMVEFTRIIARPPR